MVFNRMDIDIDSYNDNTPRLEDGNHSALLELLKNLVVLIRGSKHHEILD